MTDFSKLSRRERQILSVLFARSEATVRQIQEDLPDAPTGMAIRRMLSILEDKGHLKRRKLGREYVYAPKQAKKRAGINALQHVLDTFFEGNLDDALATHLERPGTQISELQLQRMTDLIKQAKLKGK